MKFEDLPIAFYDTETKDGWSREVLRNSTVAELLEIWDIDDEDDKCAMAQVLRHLRRIMENANM